MSLEELTEAPASTGAWSTLESSDATALTNGLPITANGRIWALDGDRDVTVVSSPDALNWSTNGGLPHRISAAACAHNGVLYVSGGGGFSAETNDVFSSTDGVNWTQRQAPWGPRYGHCMVSYRGALMVFGGRTMQGHFYQDQWMSTDGVNWQAQGSAPEYGPINAAAAVVAGRLCAVGGPASVIQWYDGTRWTTEVLPWATPRISPAVAVVDDRLYLVGGQWGQTVYSDMWSCVGRGSWRPETAPPLAKPLMGLTACELNGGLILFGGSAMDGSRSKNVYRYEP
ncbi:hypothetical protein [Phenylobacterium sp. J367]|uniref:Kelch repeat-containing protein n=1 Tax=Phenylobacterium sp. J367 TaxID=2898435 RepID=UPI002150CA1C|nr:hypothetical protein [Phenylobacterium sp. J367]MCR5878651.1 hypothetical protein [Phenylobacterium sp. J367]